jgi:pimeloyl-ACP methyl ester carboxylesterase
MNAAAVVYVHGLWLSGHEAFLLHRRLQEDRGYQWHSFNYASTQLKMSEIVDALQAFVARIDAPRLHLLGHSMGGIAIMRFMERQPQFPPGRVVFMGTPVLASRAATSVARLMLGRMLLGHAATDELLYAHERRWQSERELGLIAGTQSFSFGRLIANFDEDNDGTVAVSETRLPGAKAHLSLPVNHLGMLLSARVAQEVGNFMENGHFGT